MSIDDSRRTYKDELRSHIKEIPELVNKITFYDCRNDDEYHTALKRFDRFEWKWKKSHRRGHFGVWASTLSAWEYIASCPYDGVVLFEDDATVHKDFDFLMRKYMKELLRDWDFFSLHTPHNQSGDFRFQYNYKPDGSYAGGHRHFPAGAPNFLYGSEYLCKSYQGYGACAIMYSPKGAQRLLDFFEKNGIKMSADCHIFQASKATYPHPINGYSIIPGRTRPANVHLEAPTQIHDTEEIEDINADKN